MKLAEVLGIKCCRYHALQRLRIACMPALMWRRMPSTLDCRKMDTRLLVLSKRNHPPPTTSLAEDKNIH
jgi:hypothetical protein